MTSRGLLLLVVIAFAHGVARSVAVLLDGGHLGWAGAMISGAALVAAYYVGIRDRHRRRTACYDGDVSHARDFRSSRSPL